MMGQNLSILASHDRPRNLAQLALPSSLRILVLAPHPDDFDAIGVTLRFLARNGNAIDVGVVRTGSGVDDEDLPGLTLADKADLREHEQRRSLAFFGLPAHCLTFLSLDNDAEDQPVDSPANYAAVKALVEEKAPDMVFLPNGNDTNSGHRVIYALLDRVGQCAGRALAALLIRDPKTIAMRTDLYMMFGQAEADWKAELLRFHDSQHRRNLRTRNHGFDDRILKVNRTIAQELSLASPYAEAFQIELYNTSA